MGNLPVHDDKTANRRSSLNQSPRPTYDYLTLSYPDSIRVFVLEPSADEAVRLDGKIVEQRLSDSCVELCYNALSYVWGEQKDTREIHIEGRQLRIGQNLDAALRHLRRKDRPVRLWVDAICIDQASVIERNHQVQQMRTIYSSASETIIYLGDLIGGNTERSAWNFLERNATWAMNGNRDADLDLPAKREEMMNFRGELADVEIEVLERPWFKRLWVFQEVVVSRSLSIQCGGRRISWDDFCKALLLSPRYHDRYGFSLRLLKKVGIVRDMFQTRCSYQELQGRGHILPHWRFEVQGYKENTLHVLDLLQKARTLEASDPRDKIFGLLGISNGIDVDDQRFAIDYTQDRQTVYTNFARSIISATRSYDVLSHVDHDVFEYDEYSEDGEDEDECEEEVAAHARLPSWVPNWDLSKLSAWIRHSTRTILSTMDLRRDVEELEKYAPPDEICGWDNTGQILISAGSMIGQICDLSSAITLTRDAETVFQEIRDSEKSDEVKSYLILSHWIQNLWDARGLDGTLFRSELTNILDLKKAFEQGTVEHHLLARARKTASWRSDRDSSASAPIDEASIVDGRRIAIYKSVRKPTSRGLAIVRSSTREGDFLIDLRGGHVPFSVAKAAEHHSIEGDGMSSTPSGPWHCHLRGESVVNRTTGDASTSRERTFMIH